MPTPEERVRNCLAGVYLAATPTAARDLLRANIARDIRAAVLEEREACAALALAHGAARLARYNGLLDALGPGDRGDNLAGVAANAAAEQIAAAIRARSP